MEILIDSRECCPLIKETLNNTPGVVLHDQLLSLGDYLVDNKILFERKTVADFARSVIDGRLFRQACDLLKSDKKIAFILKGSTTDDIKLNLSRESLQGAIVMLTITLGIPLIRTLSPQETAKVILYTGHQIQPTKITLGIRHGYRPKGKRKIQLHLLQGLPGIGPARAQLLLNHFGSVEKAMTADLDALCLVPTIGVQTAKKIRWAVD